MKEAVADAGDAVHQGRHGIGKGDAASRTGGAQLRYRRLEAVLDPLLPIGATEDRGGVGCDHQVSERSVAQRMIQVLHGRGERRVNRDLHFPARDRVRFER